ncbi:unnamed protein product [Symbiodinium sp. CCMP2592]|nr:unnamed protein product [Symbiodinium sp. CCMP2592]
MDKERVRMERRITILDEKIGSLQKEAEDIRLRASVVMGVMPEQAASCGDVWQLQELAFSKLVFGTHAINQFNLSGVSEISLVSIAVQVLLFGNRFASHYVVRPLSWSRYNKAGSKLSSQNRYECEHMAADEIQHRRCG